MANPHNGGSPQPANMAEYEYLPITTDNGGVHRNSGIPNRAFYLVATAIGRGKADSIYYRALTTQLNQYSQFLDLRLALVQAASDLYPGDSAAADAIRSAFDQVQIYDGSWSKPPKIEPAPTSPQWIVARSEHTGRVALYDTAGSFLRYVSQAKTVTKPTVADSAKLIYFIDTMFMITVVDPEGTLEVQLGDTALKFTNIAISPDGHHMACDLQWDPTIYILHLGTSEDITVLPLYTPTNSEVKSYDVLYPDVIEWDIYGKDIIYDCYCETPQPSGTLRYWDIRNLEVTTGLIQRTLPSIPLGWTIGNPSFGKIHPDLIALDYVADDGSIYLYAADRRDNRVTEVASNGTSLNRATFSPDDSRILVQYDGGAGYNLWRADFSPSTLAITSNWERIIDTASYPSWRFTGRDYLTDVEHPQEETAIPSAFSLYQNYPNPFNSSTVITFGTKTWRPVELEIFNVLGQRIFSQAYETQPPGRHAITWNGQDQAGRPVPSGLYLYRVTADGAKQTRKMVVLK
jgi:WD40 repeat protein